MLRIRDFYVPGDSFVHKAHPTTKFIIMVILAATCVVSQNLVINISILIAILCLLSLAKVNIFKYRIMIIPIGAFFIIMVPLNLFRGDLEGYLFFRWWVLTVTANSILYTSITVTRVIDGAFCALLFITTTSQHEIIKSLHKLRVPTSICIAFGIALRFIPTFFLDLSNIMDAQKSRGFEWEKGNAFARLKNVFAFFVPLLSINLRRTRLLANSLDSRGYRSGKKTTIFKERKLKLRDYIVITLAVAGLASIIVDRLFFHLFAVTVNPHLMLAALPSQVRVPAVLLG